MNGKLCRSRCFNVYELMTNSLIKRLGAMFIAEAH